jgi:hypothetical protein
MTHLVDWILKRQKRNTFYSGCKGIIKIFTAGQDIKWSSLPGKTV